VREIRRLAWHIPEPVIAVDEWESPAYAATTRPPGEAIQIPIQTLCSLPKVKHEAASTALDVILDLTKARKKVQPSPKIRKDFARKTHEIKSYLEKELEDF